jgi:hypothetical protein
MVRIGEQEIAITEEDPEVIARLTEQIRFQNQSAERALGYLSGSRQIDDSGLAEFWQGVDELVPSHNISIVSPKFFKGDVPEVESFPEVEDLFHNPGQFLRVGAMLPLKYPQPELASYVSGMYWAQRVYGVDSDLVMMKVPFFGEGGRGGDITKAVKSVSLWIMSPRVVAHLLSGAMSKTKENRNYEVTRRVIKENYLSDPDAVWHFARRI